MDNRETVERKKRKENSIRKVSWGGGGAVSWAQFLLHWLRHAHIVGHQRMLTQMTHFELFATFLECTKSRTSTDANPNYPFWALCYIFFCTVCTDKDWGGPQCRDWLKHYISLTSLKQTARYLPNGHTMSLTRQGKGYGWLLGGGGGGMKKKKSMLSLADDMFIIY